MNNTRVGLGHYLRLSVIGLAVLLALATPLIFVIGAFGVKLGLIPWRAGLDAVMHWTPRAAFSALVLGVVALGLAVAVKPRFRGLFPALLALIIPAAVLYQGVQIRNQAKAAAPIHDVSTDTANPPNFSQALIALREASGAENALDNPRTMTGDGTERRVAELQHQAYPDITSVALQAEPGTAFEAAMRTAQSMGWTVQYADQGAGRIDATDTTFWFGFKDDMAIRVQLAQGGGSIVDIRSVSRVGVSDIGTNAARIRDFRDALTARAE